ncbi:response regulator receiver and ANTAR domain-containing protein [Thermincola ferriacetica]|uniref:Stage 0 sporulation protein A homolog n=2 Tax=Thermincola TaxID=278993 RepID=D5XCF1_THEPJ|nr:MULTISPECIES: ANTAR domain-containing protein [Thermincola]ADG81577.1 response regulator receiver and ANTAR domain protein [Thermincola potens JR]KNZ69868.1 response regulator receiver and ANTAR domain-containing protein [Thermincola ferriacetica]
MDERRVIIADPDPASRKNLKALLNKAGYLVVGEAEDGLTALKLIRYRQPDLVIMEAKLAVLEGAEIGDIVEEDGLAPVILIGTPDQVKLPDYEKEKRFFAYVIKPVDERNLFPVIDLVIRNYNRIRALEEEIVKLKNTLETRKLVEKAKGILMDTLGLTEAEAFRRIQKQSMNKRMSMQAVAKAIILAHDLK